MTWIAFAILLQFHFVDCGEFLSPEQRLYPHFHEIAPCPCDLSPQRCDTYCCCDQDCPEEARHNFSCVEGLFGGHHDRHGLLPLENCSSNLDYTRIFIGDIHPLLCMIRFTSPYLGQFFSESPILQSSSIVEKLKADKTKKGSDFRSRIPKDAPLRNRYKFGRRIRTIYNLERGIKGWLHMPVSTGHGFCVMSPIRYLRGHQTSCLQILEDKTSCDGLQFSLADHRLYLTANETVRIAKSLSSSHAIPVKVSYYSISSSHEYTNLAGVHKANTDNKIDDLFRIRNGPEIPKTERMNQRFGVVKTGDNPRPIHFDSVAQSCNNFVLEVEYHLFWIGENLTKVEADILLGNVGLHDQNENPLKQYVQQRMAAEFHHHNQDAHENEDETGNPGYSFGQDVFTEGGGENTFNVFLQSSSSLCRDSRTSRIQFGVNTFSGCNIQLSKSNLSDCELLREQVGQFMEGFVLANSVGKGPRPKNDSDMLEVIRVDEETNDINDTDTVNVCNVPSQNTIHILYTRATVRSAEPIFRISGVKISKVSSQWKWTCGYGSLPGKCSSVQNFNLQSQVLFEEIPLIWHHQNTSRFWIKNDMNNCPLDTCWGQILYPINIAKTGDQIAGVVQSFMLIISVSFIILILTRHHW